MGLGLMLSSAERSSQLEFSLRSSVCGILRNKARIRWNFLPHFCRFVADSLGFDFLYSVYSSSDVINSLPDRLRLCGSLFNW